MRIPTFTLVAAARCAAAALVAVLLAGCANDSPEKLMASAKEYLAKGDRNAALIQLKNLLAEAPDNGEARLLLGQAQFDAGDAVSAEKELARALQLKQPQEKVVPLYVQSLLAQGKLKEAIAEGQKYRLFDNAAVATTQTALGDAYRRLGNREQAAQAYAAATAAVPGYSRARLGSALLLAGEGQADAALKQADEVIAADPKLVEARLLRAEILLARGDRAGARKTLEEAIAAEGRFLPARLMLADLLIADGDLDAAAKQIEGARKAAPADLRVTFQEATLAFRKGDRPSARQKVQEVLKSLPDYAPALALSAAIDLQERQYVAAEASLRKAVARAPGNDGARQMLVRTYLAMGQPAKAREALQPLVDKGAPADPQLLLLAGETYLANNDLKRASAFYEQAAKAQGEQQAAARTRLGQIALATGRSDEGFRELEAAAALDAGGHAADLAIITGHLRRNETGKAMEAVKALEKKQPDNPLTFHMYGLVNLAKGDRAAARQGFERALALQAGYLASAQRLAQLDIEENRPEEARKRYEAMIAREPGNEQLYLALAELQLAGGAAPAEVAATLQRAVKGNPESATARVALISFLVRAGQTKSALTEAQAALAAMPAEPRVLEAAGVAQEAAGEINQAISTYGKLASLQPQSLQPLFRLATLYSRQKDPGKAVETLRRAQKIAPDDRNVVPAIVQAYLVAGGYDEALKEARALQRRAPKAPDGWALEGDVHLLQKQFADAERAYREALRLDARAGVLAVRLHVALAGSGKTAEAEAWARKWIGDNPKDTAMRMHLAEREYAARNLKAAAAHYQAVIGVEPNNVTALNNLAAVGGELGDPKAIGHAERAAKLAPTSADVLDTYAKLLLKKGDAGAALPVLERAHRLAPARNDIRLNYAKALAGAGRKDDARKELEALQGVKDDFSGKDEVAGLLKAL
jgi:putative PEP-CTERM system TPR-repeat lipoprotein